MPARPAHFAINLDDDEVGRASYAAVFGWTFTDWGHPGFSRVDLGPQEARAMIGAVQHRRHLVDPPTTGVELTFAVDDLAEVVRLVPAHGGRLLTEVARVPGAGDLVWLADPSGNVVGAMQYAPGA